MSAGADALKLLIKLHDMSAENKPRRELYAFVMAWPCGSIVGKRADEQLTREEMDERIIRKLSSEPLFKRQFFANPRFCMAMAVEEALGINKYAFVGGIETVHVLQETPRQLYLILPSCHRGCMQDTVSAPPDGPGQTTCHVCGVTKPAAPDGATCGGQERSLRAISSARKQPLSRKDIEDEIKRSAKLDHGLKQDLMTRPMEAYSSFVRGLCGGDVPPYLDGVAEIRILEEDTKELYFIIPATGGGVRVPGRQGGTALAYESGTLGAG